MKAYYTRLLGMLFCISVQTQDNTVLHKLDDKALLELKGETEQKLQEAITGGRAKFEYCNLVDRIEFNKTHEKIFTSNEQQCFDTLIGKIFQNNDYKDAFA